MMTRQRMILLAVMAMMAPVMGAFGGVPVAVAAPQGVFSVFAQCPTEVPGVVLCAYSRVTGGELAIGTMRVPIDQPIVLQSGDIPTGNPENEREFFELPAKHGESISRTELDVPGGLSSIVDCGAIKGRGFRARSARELCGRILESRFAGVSATLEVVASEKDPAIFNEYNAGSETGAAQSLPTRLRLKSPFLGDSCYIGSEASPLQLELTTGETHPPGGFPSLHGAFGEPETLKENGLRMLRITGSSIVDNTFTAPVAEGCGGPFLPSGFLDIPIDSKLQLPNAPGNNTAILSGEEDIATVEAVTASETSPEPTPPTEDPGHHHREWDNPPGPHHWRH
jgi:hypothetical protein